MSDYIAGDRITRKIDHDLADGIAGYCNDHKISAAVLLESTVLIYLLRINPDHGKISIGVPVLNRGHVAEKKTSGMFISTIPLTVKADRTDTISSFIKKVAVAQRAAFRHQRYPYEEIVKEVRRNHSFGGDL